MRLLSITFLVLLSFGLQAQSKFYFVEFKDKPGATSRMYQPKDYLSLRAIERRTTNRVPLSENDIPPDSAYLARLSSMPLLMYGNSRWLNGALVLSDSKIMEDSVKRLPFVDEITYVGPAYPDEYDNIGEETSLENRLNMLEQQFDRKLVTDSLWLGRSAFQIRQLNDEALMNKGYSGKGVLVAVLDAGFRNADKIKAFSHLFKERKILAAYDFVEKEEEVFEDDEHGTAVLSCLAAKLPGELMGTATGATYLLFRTENATSEYLVEEYFWLLAAEYADSAGTDIISSSLGYSKHDERKMGHKYGDLDGKTTVVTRAAEIAASKGILVVVSAGNEGDDPWRQLCAPADAEHALTVGAVDRFGTYAGFSSLGPTADKRVKPDLVAQGKGTALLSVEGRVYEGNGTSYACPLVAGVAAQLMEAVPGTPSQKLKEIMMLSGSQYFKTDKYLGSGIPDLQLAYGMLSSRLDTVFNIKALSDQNFHVSLFSRIPQKVELSIQEPVNGELETQTVSLRKGANRFMLKGNKKRPDGIYHLSVGFQLKKAAIDFRKP